MILSKNSSLEKENKKDSKIVKKIDSEILKDLVPKALNFNLFNDNIFNVDKSNSLIFNASEILKDKENINTNNTNNMNSMKDVKDISSVIYYFNNILIDIWWF